MLKHYLRLLAISTIVLYSCNNETDGGGCKYETTVLPATLIQLVDINSHSYDALFEVTVENKKDTIAYSRLNSGQYIFISEKPKKQLVTGRQYQYIMQKIITGACNPEVNVISLTAFEKK